MDISSKIKNQNKLYVVTRQTKYIQLENKFLSIF